jgi:hypothetical protein
MANPANTTAYRLPDGRLAVNVTEAKTLASEDGGYVQNVIYADGVVTVPATATQGNWTIRNGGVPKSGAPAGTGSDGNKIEVDCDASDTFQGLNVTGAASNGKKLINTAATARVGDEVTIVNTGATDGPIIQGGSVIGIWAREG